jgi:hypothetical protein
LGLFGSSRNEELQGLAGVKPVGEPQGLSGATTVASLITDQGQQQWGASGLFRDIAAILNLRAYKREQQQKGDAVFFYQGQQQWGTSAHL